MAEGGARAGPGRAERGLLERVAAADAVDGGWGEVELPEGREGAEHGREAGEEALCKNEGSGDGAGRG